MNVRGKNNWTIIAIIAVLLVMAGVYPVTAAPTVDFTNATTPRSGTVPLTVMFTDLSIGTPPMTYEWDFENDGVTDSTIKDPSHEYTSVGTYSVNLTVTDSVGENTSVVKVDYITVEPAPVKPVAEFTNTTPRSGTAPLIVSFTDQSTGSITSHAWDFNNDGTNESILQNPSPYTYTTAGTYTVKLTVTGPGGSDSEIKTDYITVGEVPPVAGFSGTPTSGPKPLGVQFTDASNGVINTYTWDFGDGHTSNAQNPSHNYPAIGSYTVTLTVTGPGGSDSETKDNYIIVGDSPPIAGFSGTPTSGQKPLNVAFSDASTGNITSYAWNFGDGNTSTLMNPSHQYTDVASYTVTLTVTGPGGPDSETKSNYITVTNTTTKIGTFKEGVGVWNLRITEGISDLTFTYGAAGNTQLAGDWNGDGKPEAGVYNNGIWYLDYNGNGVYDGPVADRTASFGSAGYKPVVGDWDGTGKDKIGSEKDGFWAIDYNGNYVWEGGVIDRYAGFGQPGDNPVVGDWDGTGKDKIGSEKDGFWAIDYNGNYVWDGAVTDRFAGFGQPGDNPVVGDWDGTGNDKIGMEINGFWATDYNGNYVWDGAVTDRFAGFGQTEDIPVVGDWDGNGRTEIGSFKDGFWSIDYNGNYVWDGAVTDRFAGYGQTGDKPVIGDWDGNGRTEIGSFKDGFWAIDYNGNYVWDGGNSSGVYTAYTFLGVAGWTPIVGDWNGSGMTKIGVYKDASWNLDFNGNGVWDSGDKECVFPSQTFSQPVVGDWNGDGKTKVGYWLYGLWHLDYLGAGTYSTTYSFIGPDLYTNYIPVVGDWNGDRKTEMGVYNKLSGAWYLDYDGNGDWNSGSDRGYNFGVGVWTPVVGDWNGNGTTKIGVYKDGEWRLDYDGNFAWNASVDKSYTFRGMAGWTPVIGDWNGDGKSKIGVYNNGDWNLDYDGNGVWDATADKVYNIGVGTPVVGKWS